MRSKNPFLKRFESQTSAVNNSEIITDFSNTMTSEGVINKSLILLSILLGTSILSWYLTSLSLINPMVLTFGGGIIGFILVLIASFKPQHAKILAPGYALFEGLFIGGVSAFFEAMYPGIVVKAVGATFVTFIVCFLLYKYRIVKVTERFKSVVIGATLAIFSFYLISFVLSLFMSSFTPIHHGNSLLSIGISVGVVIIAALNLFLDFEQIETGVAKRYPKFMEWFSAMGLLITLVWLYIEILRLLAKLASRD